MPDADVDLGASALFGLTTTNGFHAQESDSEPTSDESVAFKANGDMACHSEHNNGDTFRNPHKYCGATLGTALGSLATALGGVVGTGAAAKLVTELVIDFPGDGEQAELSIVGHSHDTNNHSATTNPPRTFDISSLIPSGAGLGVPQIFTAAGEVAGNASRTRARMSFRIEHNDKPANGGHFTGENVRCICEADTDYEGNCGTITAGNWKQILVPTHDDNEETDTSSVSAHQWVDAS